MLAKGGAVAKKKWIISGVTLLSLVFVVWWRLGIKEPLTVSVDNLTDCLLEGNTNCVLSYVSEAEIASMKANGSDLEGTVDLLVAQYEGWIKIGQPEFSLIKNDTAILGIQPIQSDKGRSAELVVSLRQGPNHNEIAEFSKFAVIEIIVNRWPESDGPFPRGRTRMTYFGTKLKEMVPEFNNLNLRGIAHYDSAKNNYSFDTLESYSENLLSRGVEPDTGS